MGEVEVWACSGEEALQEQKKQKLWQKRQAQKHAVIPRNWDDNPDKAIMEMAGTRSFGSLSIHFTQLTIPLQGIRSPRKEEIKGLQTKDEAIIMLATLSLSMNGAKRK